MPDVIIYGPQDWSAGDISVPTVFHSNLFDGSDAPLAGYPELARAENVERKEGIGVGGTDVLDAVDTLDYSVSWCALIGLGPLSNGQYDCRGGGAGFPLHCKWTQFFSSSALAEGDRYPLVMVHGMNGGSDTGLGTGNIFLMLLMLDNGGGSFDWQLGYRHVTMAGATTVTFVTGSSDTADNAEHEIIVQLVPATVTGAFTGTGGIGSATVASDGSISVTVDGVSVVSVSGVQFVINQLSSSNPGCYYGRGLWHGD